MWTDIPGSLLPSSDESDDANCVLCHFGSGRWGESESRFMDPAYLTDSSDWYPMALCKRAFSCSPVRRYLPSGLPCTLSSFHRRLCRRPLYAVRGKGGRWKQWHHNLQMHDKIPVVISNPTTFTRLTSWLVIPNVDDINTTMTLILLEL